jgi:membrane protease subunit HflK
LILLWASTGIYIVEPAEVGVIQRFGAFNRMTQPGPHYHFPFPVEEVTTPKVSQVQRVEIGFRGAGEPGSLSETQFRQVPEEALMLTGDENIISVQSIVQYQIKDAEDYLFNIVEQRKTVKDAAEAAMREVIGRNRIDTALTQGKTGIQNDTRSLLQEILDSYRSGISVVAVQMQDVHPPKQVVESFKDVASAREDKTRFINESQAYRNGIIPRTRGEMAELVREAEGFKEVKVRQAQGDTARFLKLFSEYKKAKEITTERLYLEAMEKVLSRPGTEKTIISKEAMDSVVPYLPLERLPRSGQDTGQGGGK